MYVVKSTDNQKMLVERHNNKKLAIALSIVGTGLIAYHFGSMKIRDKSENKIFGISITHKRWQCN